MLGLVFWLASPFFRAWHRHRVVLACTPYGWVQFQPADICTTFTKLKTFLELHSFEIRSYFELLLKMKQNVTFKMLPHLTIMQCKE